MDEEFVVATTAPSTDSVIEPTATLSVALTLIVTIPETVAPFVGFMIVTTGGVVSTTAVTVSANVGLVDVALAVSPLYFATMLSVPAGRLADAHFATPLESAALQRAAPLAVKFTVPVGDLPVTVAVNVTLVPAAAGLRELVTAVDVAARAAEETWTVASVAGTDGTLIVMP